MRGKPGILLAGLFLTVSTCGYCVSHGLESEAAKARLSFEGVRVFDSAIPIVEIPEPDRTASSTFGNTQENTETLFVSHRGASGLAPENTMAAFKLALEMNVKAIELDVRQTRDGRLVVIHDGHLERVARPRLKPEWVYGPSGYQPRYPRRVVGNLDWSQLSSVDVGTWFDPKFSSERIPLLEDVLDLVGEDVVLYIEVKKDFNSQYPGIEENLLALLHAKKRDLKSVVILSFNRHSLFKLRRLSSDVRLCYCVAITGLKRTLKDAVKMKAEYVSYWKLSPRWVEEVHKQGMEILVYTVNTFEEVLEAIAMGINGIVTNFPNLTDGTGVKAGADD